jgi:hypothetical protein
MLKTKLGESRVESGNRIISYQVSIIHYLVGHKRAEKLLK